MTAWTSVNRGGCGGESAQHRLREAQEWPRACVIGFTLKQLPVSLKKEVLTRARTSLCHAATVYAP